MKRFFSVLNPLLLVLSGCSTPYFGYSEGEWNNLSEDEQAAIKAEYQPIIDARAKQAHQDIIDERTESVINLGVNGTKFGPR